jgi:membrane protein DedA with SNARE-associated domain
MFDRLADIAQWAIDVVYSSGYVGVFVVVALANVHLPIPSELTLPLSGFLVGQGRFSFALVMVAATAGGVVGALAHYLPGRWFGEERLRKLVRRIERYKIVTESDLDMASRAFERHGGKAIVVGHLVPGIGSLISVPAGIARMPLFGRFMFYTVLGSALWNVIFVVLGLVLGANWPTVKQYAFIIEYAVLAVLFLVVLRFLWRRWRARK